MYEGWGCAQPNGELLLHHHSTQPHKYHRDEVIIRDTLLLLLIWSDQNYSTIKKESFEIVDIPCHNDLYQDLSLEFPFLSLSLNQPSQKVQCSAGALRGGEELNHTIMGEWELKIRIWITIITIRFPCAHKSWKNTSNTENWIRRRTGAFRVNFSLSLFLVIILLGSTRSEAFPLPTIAGRFYSFLLGENRSRRDLFPSLIILASTYYYY